MAKPAFYSLLLLAFAMSWTFLTIPVNGQNASSLCTRSMMQSFNPCMSFLTQGSGSPTSDCCSSLKDLMSNGQNCLCLIITGGVPFRVPINRTLAMSLPRACNMQGVPVKCKAPAASPVPPPDPGNNFENSPTTSPFSPPAPFDQQPLTPPPPSALAPEGDDVVPTMTPPPPSALAPEGDDVVPTMTPPGMKPTLSLSNTQPLKNSPLLPSLVLACVVFLKCL